MKNLNWERGFFRVWFLVSIALLGLVIIEEASEPNTLLLAITVSLTLSAIAFAHGYVMCKILRSFFLPNDWEDWAALISGLWGLLISLYFFTFLLRPELAPTWLGRAVFAGLPIFLVGYYALVWVFFGFKDDD